MQYTAEEKGKQKVPQGLYQPIGDSQEARELEESLLLSRLQVAGPASTRMLAAIDPEMPGSEPPSPPTLLTYGKLPRKQMPHAGIGPWRAPSFPPISLCWR